MTAFIRHALASAVAAAVLVMSSASPASAQNIGTFPFALQPFCNTVVLTVTLEGSTYRLAGWDDACGANLRQPVYGTIAPNADGTLNISFSNVRPTGIGVETSIRNFNLGSFTGNWTDSAGNAGVAGIVGLSGTVGSGGARPGPVSTLLANSVTSVNIVNGSVEAVDVNNTQIQLRVSGTCAAGSFIRSINPDGTVLCGSGPSTKVDERSVVNGITTCEDLAALDFGTVGAGTLTCSATATANFNHVTGVLSQIEFDIETAPASCGGLQRSVFEMPGSAADITGHDVTVPVHRAVLVPAGTLQVFLNGRTLGGLAANVLSTNLSCTYTPQ